MSELCNGQNIVDSIEAIDNNADKVKYVDLVLSQCATGTGEKPQHIKDWEKWMKEKHQPVKPTTSRRMNSWICYLKNCAKTTNLTYLDCVKDKVRAKREYYPKKEHWEQEALKGC